MSAGCPAHWVHVEVAVDCKGRRRKWQSGRKWQMRSVQQCPEMVRASVAGSAVFSLGDARAGS